MIVFIHLTVAILISKFSMFNFFCVHLAACGIPFQVLPDYIEGAEQVCIFSVISQTGVSYFRFSGLSCLFSFLLQEDWLYWPHTIRYPSQKAYF